MSFDFWPLDIWITQLNHWYWEWLHKSKYWEVGLILVNHGKVWHNLFSFKPLDLVAFAIRAMYGLPWCCWCQAIKQIYEWPHVPCMLLEASPHSWLLNLNFKVELYVHRLYSSQYIKKPIIIRTLTSTSFLQDNAALSNNCDSMQSFGLLNSWTNGHFGVDKYLRSNDICMP